MRAGIARFGAQHTLECHLGPRRLAAFEIVDGAAQNSVDPLIAEVESRRPPPTGRIRHCDNRFVPEVPQALTPLAHPLLGRLGQRRRVIDDVGDPVFVDPAVDGRRSGKRQQQQQQ